MPTFRVTRTSILVHENIVDAPNGQVAMWNAMRELQQGIYDGMYVQGERKYRFEAHEKEGEAA